VYISIKTKSIFEIQQEHYNQAQGIPAQQILSAHGTKEKYAGRPVKENRGTIFINQKDRRKA